MTVKPLQLVAITGVLAGLIICFLPEKGTKPGPGPEPQPISTDLLDKADDSYRAGLADLVGVFASEEWTSQTKKAWTESITDLRATTHGEVADRLAQAFADQKAAELVEPIREGTWQ